MTTTAERGLSRPLSCALIHAALIAQGAPDLAWVRGGGSHQCVAVSGDGSLIATGGAGIKLWRAADQTLLRTVPAHPEGELALAFSPDGQLLASAGGDGVVRLWRTVDGAHLRSVAGAGRSWGVAFSPDGTLLASCETGGSQVLPKVLVRRVADGALVWSRTVGGSEVYSVAFSPDGQTVACGIDIANSAGSVELVRASDGTLLRTLTGHTGAVLDVRFSPDGTLLVSGSWDQTARLWRVADGRLLRTLVGHSGGLGGIHAVAFSPDGQVVATGAADTTIRLWNVPTGAMLRVLTGHRRDVYDLAFMPDGVRLLSVSGDNDIRAWRTADGAPLGTLNWHSGPIWRVAPAPDGRYLASASEDGRIRLWQAADGALLRTLDHVEGVLACCFSPDATLLATGNDCGQATCNDLRLWRVADGGLVRVLAGHNGYATTAAAFTPDGQRLVSGGGDTRVRVWRVADGVLLFDLQRHTTTVTAVAVSPDGTVAASGDLRGEVQLWRLADGAPLWTATAGAWVSELAFSPDGAALATGTLGRALCLRRVSDGSVIRCLDTANRRVQSFAFQPEGHVLIAALIPDQGGPPALPVPTWLRLWQVSDGAVLATYDQETWDASAVSALAGGGRFAFGRGDGTVALARQAPLATSLPFGHGCPGSGGEPAVAAAPGSRPRAGASFAMRVTNLPEPAIALVLFGASRSRWGALVLPFDLTAAGMPGCSLLADGLSLLAVAPAGPGIGAAVLAVPGAAELLGARLFFQALAIDPAANPAGVIWSNGLAGIVGVP